MRRQTRTISAAMLAAIALALLGFTTAQAAPIARAMIPDPPRQTAEPAPPAGRSNPLARPAAITDTVALTGTAAISDDEAITIGTAITATSSVSAPTTLSNNAEVTNTASVTTTDPLTATPGLTGTSAPTIGVAITATQTVSDAANLDEQYDEIVEGTIIANRTDANVRFFLEGETFLIDPLRSLGFDLPRVTAVLSLYNCDADRPESEVECYWDPYLLNRDGFYEVVGGAEEDLTVGLTLREAGAPPVDQVWIQNRTGKGETVVYKTITYELAPATVQEFTVSGDALPTFFLRSCVEVDGAGACEWAPVVVEPGFYYGLEEQNSVGGLPNSSLSSLTLTPVLAGGSEEAIEAVEENTPAQMLCSVLVPALNVRSGPGLEYEIVAKVRGTEDDPASVVVIGQNETSEWLAVAPRIADGGWITGSPNYVSCTGDVAALPLTEITDGRLAPTPEPVAVAPTTEDGNAAPGDGEAVAATESITQTEDAGAPAVPAGLAVLQVRNDFDHIVRFTIDQKFRPESGPSEYDLEPGQSISLVVWPGLVAFSASSPWRGLSGNAEVFFDPDTSRNIKLVFVPDPDGSGSWDLLAWE